MEIPIQNNKSLTLSTRVRQFRISKSHRLHGCFCPSMYLRESYVFFFFWSSLTSNRIWIYIYIYIRHIPSYRILFYPIFSHPILSYPILSYPILSYPSLSYLFYQTYHTISYQVISYHIVSVHLILAFLTTSYLIAAMSCDPPRLLPLKTAQPPLSSALQKHQELKARELKWWPSKGGGWGSGPVNIKWLIMVGIKLIQHQ